MKLVIKATARDVTGTGWTTYDAVEIEMTEGEFQNILTVVREQLGRDSVPAPLADFLTSLTALIDRCNIQSY